ncbi:MAG: endopeptidase La [Burkholderiales bacterium]
MAAQPNKEQSTPVDNDKPLEGELLEGETETPSPENKQVPVPLFPSPIYLLPLPERPFFPAQTLPLVMYEGAWLETMKNIGETPHHMVGMCLIKPDSPDNVKAVDFYRVGTLVRVQHPVRADGTIQFIAEGITRFRITRWISEEPPFVAQVEYPAEGGDQSTDKLRAYAMAIINSIKDLLPLNPLFSEGLKQFLSRFSPNEPSRLADFAASLTTASKQDLQQVMEGFHLLRRMEKVLVLIKKEIDVARLQAKIREQVQENMDKQQREFLLREQLKTIQKELGIAKDDKTAEIERLEARIAKLNLPEATKIRIDEEMRKLSVLETGSPEYAVTRNYLDWLSALPWGIFSEDKINLSRAREILDHDHYGLEDVKQRIIEFLAVGALRGQVAGSILLLLGPPGVGKTSVGRSIANALGRSFYRFSLGGMRDEAEIKGHRRTYIGAMPGKFIQAVKEIGVANPVIMLDEIDKIGASYQGDPASALLEVLDPEQNRDFLDHYLDVRFDLSKVLFVCTANQLDTIPGALLDRMETIRLAGYITAEKVQIAKRYLWPKQLEKAGIKRSRLGISDAALRYLVEGYAREAGVRGLEKQLGRIVRKSAVKIVGGQQGAIRVAVKQVEDLLGKPLFRNEKPLSAVGVVTGLAWTSLGGDVLSIEATRVHDKKRGFMLTGKLGEVMKESAEIAYSYVSSHLDEFRGDAAFFDQAHIHLHVPEGATPKDGPSAGITMASALLSLARGEKLARPLAMTGELTLTGRVLAVGGIREKVIAARRNRVTEIVLPDANRRDFDELPDHIRKGMRVHFVKTFADVVKIVFSGRRR